MRRSVNNLQFFSITLRFLLTSAFVPAFPDKRCWSWPSKVTFVAKYPVRFIYEHPRFFLKSLQSTSFHPQASGEPSFCKTDSFCTYVMADTSLNVDLFMWCVKIAGKIEWNFSNHFNYPFNVIFCFYLQPACVLLCWCNKWSRLAAECKHNWTGGQK